MGRGLAEQLGAIDRKGRGFGLSREDIGLDVTGYVKEKLPHGHRFFVDCDRESNARMIEWMMTRNGIESWFITLTFKNYVPENRAKGLVGTWLHSVWDAHCRMVSEKKYDRSHGLTWVIAQEWQKRNVVHFHIILSGVRLGDLSRKRWELRWSGMTVKIADKVYSPCGFARIYDARPKAAPYLAKYTGKTYHSGVLVWGGTWRGYSPPDSLRCCKALIPG